MPLVTLDIVLDMISWSPYTVSVLIDLVSYSILGCAGSGSDGGIRVLGDLY